MENIKNSLLTYWIHLFRILVACEFYGALKTRQLDLSHHILAVAAQIRQRDIKSKIKNLEKSLQETEAEIRKS